MFFPLVKSWVQPEHSSSVGELSETQQKQNVLVSLRKTDILGPFSYNPQQNKMQWEFFLNWNISPAYLLEKNLFEKMKHNHCLNGLSLGQGTRSMLSGHRTLHSWWLNYNGSTSAKATLIAYCKRSSHVRKAFILDQARDSQKMKSILLILPVHHRDEVRDHSICHVFPHVC